MRFLLCGILALSVALNVVLLLERPTRGLARVAAPKQNGAAAAGTGAAAPVDVSRLDPELVRNLGAGDPVSLRDFLVACGMDREAIRWLVTCAIRHRHEPERTQAIWRTRGEGWWKAVPNWWDVAGRERIDANEQKEIEAIIGDYPLRELPWEVERWDFLNVEKRAALRNLKQDYAELRTKLPPAPWLPAEAEMNRRLDEEYRRDLETLLSKAELQEHDYREAAEYMGQSLAQYDLSEVELRALFALQEEQKSAVAALARKYSGSRVDDPFAPLGFGWSDPKAAAEAREIAQSYDTKFAALIGEERLARGNREADEGFRSIVRLTDKFRLPKPEAERLHALLTSAETELREGDWRLLPDEDRATRLAAIREDAMGEISARFPPEGVELFVKQIGWRYSWLTRSE